VLAQRSAPGPGLWSLGLPALWSAELSVQSGADRFGDRRIGRTHAGSIIPSTGIAAITPLAGIITKLTRDEARRIAATITNLLWNKGYDGSDSRANKNRLYVRTDVRRLRRTTRFERNDPNDAQTRSCPRKRERALHRTADTY
jgi:hypothetical protein